MEEAHRGHWLEIPASKEYGVHLEEATDETKYRKKRDRLWEKKKIHYKISNLNI